MPWRQRIDGIKKIYLKLDLYQKDFPDSQKDLRISQAFVYPRVNITKSELTEMAQLCPRYREMDIKVHREKYFPYDLSDGINSIKELSNMYRVAIRTNRVYHYYNQQKWLNSRLDSMHSVLKEALKMVEKNPKLLNDVNNLFNSSHNGDDLTHLYDIHMPNIRFDQTQAMKNHLHYSAKFRADALNSPFTAFQKLALALEFLSNCVEKPRTTEAVSTEYKHYFTRVQNFNSEFLQDKQIVCSRFMLYWINSHTIGQDSLDKFKSNNNPKIQKNDIICALRNKDVKTILKGNILRLTDSQIASLYNELSYILFPSPRFGQLSSNSTIDKLSKEVNCNFKIKSQTFRQLFNSKAYLFAVAAVEKADGIHLLMCHPRNEVTFCIENGKHQILYHSKKLFYGVIFRNGTVSTLQELPVQYNNLRYQGNFNYLAQNHTFFDLNQDYLVIATENSKLHIINRKTNKQLIIDDFLSGMVNNIALIEDRIYVLNSSPNHIPKVLSFSSIKIDGKKRKIYFNNQRSDKQSNLDNLKDNLFGLVGDSQYLYFVNYKMYKYGAIYRFDLNTEKISLLKRYPHHFSSLTIRNRKLYLQGQKRFFEFDLHSQQLKTIFDQRVFGKTYPRLAGTFLVDGNDLWVSGKENAMITLKNPNQSPLLLIPDCMKILPWNNKKLYLSQSRYFVIEKRRVYENIIINDFLPTNIFERKFKF